MRQEGKWTNTGNRHTRQKGKWTNTGNRHSRQEVSGPILAIGTLDRKAGRPTGHQQTNKTWLTQTGVEVSRQEGREGEQGDRFTDRQTLRQVCR